MLAFFWVCFLRQGFFCVALAGLKLLIHLPLPPEHWDYRHKTPSPSILFCLFGFFFFNIGHERSNQIELMLTEIAVFLPTILSLAKIENLIQ